MMVIAGNEGPLDQNHKFASCNSIFEEIITILSMSAVNMTSYLC